MANKEHLAKLKEGVETWNRWRQKNPNELPNLGEAELSGVKLSRVNLSKAYLTDADLSRAVLTNANLSETNLRTANLRKADLGEANLSEARLHGVDLSGANLRGANFSLADLSGANLHKADLTETDLFGAYLQGGGFRETKLTGAKTWFTQFCDIDLSVVKGLDTIKHLGPSYISFDTIYRSKGKIPESFLRGAGVPDNFIEYMASLVGKAFEFYSCFISYSSKDQGFADRLYNDLQGKGVRCWFAPEHMKIGDKIRVRLDESIRLYDKLLLVLSEHSVTSDWVEQEVETALSKERKTGQLVLFPVRLDDEVMNIDTGWPSLISNTRHIGDFTNWKDHDAYQKAFERLMRDLKGEKVKTKRRTLNA